MVGRSKDPKRYRITIRLGEREYAALHAQARQNGESVGAILREIIRRAMRRRRV